VTEVYRQRSFFDCLLPAVTTVRKLPQELGQTAQPRRIQKEHTAESHETLLHRHRSFPGCRTAQILQIALFQLATARFSVSGA
jgi:hypothetical protein